MKIILVKERCIHCGACRQYCPENAIETFEGRMRILESKCTNCGKCRKACYMRAIKKVEV